MPSGARASINYGWEETAFQTKSASIDKTFGIGAKLTDLTRNNNLEIIYGLGDREAAVNLEKQFQGSFAVETALSDPWIFKAYFGDAFTATDGTTGKAAATTLTGVQAIGATSLVVASSTGYAASDIIKIAGGTSNTYEIRKVTGASDGTHIEIDKPLHYSHPASGAVTEINGTGQTNYYHVFRNLNAPSLNTITVQNTIDLAADYQTNFLGSIPVGASISTAVGSPVMASYDFIYGKEDPEDSPAFVAQVASTAGIKPYTFAYGNLYTPASSTSALTAVQSCEISISPTLDLIYGLGSRTASNYVEMQYDYTISSEMYFQNKNDYLALFMDGTSTFPVTGPGTTVAENGLVLHLNDGTNTMVFSFGGVKADSTSMPQDPTAPIMESVTLRARTLHVYAYNATSAIP